MRELIFFQPSTSPAPFTSALHFLSGQAEISSNWLRHGKLSQNFLLNQFPNVSTKALSGQTFLHIPKCSIPSSFHRPNRSSVTNPIDPHTFSTWTCA